ncbi:NAD(P)/FAD-dependent oxidoreductase, partial [[Pasteurella] aerogenes]
AGDRKIPPGEITGTGTGGCRAAGVSMGGLDTQEIFFKTVGAQRVSALDFIGEVLDVTGGLGGYNFQWVWRSADACAQALCAKLKG